MLLIAPNGLDLSHARCDRNRHVIDKEALPCRHVTLIPIISICFFWLVLLLLHSNLIILTPPLTSPHIPSHGGTRLPRRHQ